jgi:hypothetical protein
MTGSINDYASALKLAVEAATAMTGDRDRAATLLRDEPLRAFGFKTGETLVREGRVADLIAYLEPFAAGASG